MPKFGPSSLTKRATLADELTIVLDAAIERVDFVITDGLRGEAEQNEAFRLGRSKTPYPKSKHNGSNGDPTRSDAADVMPYFAEAPHIRYPDKKKDTPIEYARNMAALFNLLLVILEEAEKREIRLRIGAQFTSFFDGPHIEVVRPASSPDLG